MKKLLAALLLVLAVLAAVMLYRAATVFEDSQPEPAGGFTAVRIDQQSAVGRFSRALTFQTISHDDRSRFDARAFRDFHDFLQTAFP
ncbi:MAG TPA: hypothetical protein VFG48_13315, partial [Xanthomonadales bacterium]|nr:hypothetical protein [Xanthomonadales bacterium]